MREYKIACSFGSRLFGLGESNRHNDNVENVSLFCIDVAVAFRWGDHITASNLSLAAKSLALIIVIPGPDHHVRVSSWRDHIWCSLVGLGQNRDDHIYSVSMATTVAKLFVAGRGCKLAQLQGVDEIDGYMSLTCLLIF